MYDLKCKVCEQELPERCFAPNRGPKYRLGRHHVCNICRKATAKAPRHAGREEILEVRKGMTSE